MNRLLASEMAKRVRVQRVIRQYDNVNRFMHSVEEAFINSKLSVVAVILSQVNVENRLRVNTLDELGREATLEEHQELFTMLGFPTNCFRCPEGEGEPGEAYIQVCLPHPFLR